MIRYFNFDAFFPMYENYELKRRKFVLYGMGNEIRWGVALRLMLWLK